MIRRYQAGDEQAIARIYHDATLQLAANDYTPEQLEAWAKPPVDPAGWSGRCKRKRPFVNEIDGQIAGFIELDLDGHVDCTYVDPEFAAQGAMFALMLQIKVEARQMGLQRLFAEVSITARPFFETQGFAWVRGNLAETRGVTLRNFIMGWQLELNG